MLGSRADVYAFYTGLVLSKTPMSPRKSRVVSNSSKATIGLRPLRMMWVGKRGVRFGLPVTRAQRVKANALLNICHVRA
jgi:hypothetical protein